MIRIYAVILAAALLAACTNSRDVAPSKEIAQSGPLKVDPRLIKDPQPQTPANSAPAPAGN